ncbi:MAG TPA: hypothetical protein DCS05_00465 [Nitrospiraceae bacterium]|nr:hypothetical protein [Nitrospiraceae bacterium]
MTLGDNIRKLRELHHWTQVDLAKISGVSEKYISAIERGERGAGHKSIERFCDAFAVTEEVLRYGYQRAKFTRQEVKLIEALRRDREKLAVALELAKLPGDAVPFVREAVRLMRRYPERRRQ